MSTLTVSTSPSPSTIFSCPLCCEDRPSSHICVLTNCRHESCRECCVKWIEKAESSGHYALPACPWCRLPMTLEETQQYLERPFQPATRTANMALSTELDDLTLQWLNEQTQPCPSCGARIEKVVGGCDLMECLCGYRFCYGCGSQGAHCSCTPSHHYFWDNVLDRAAQRAAPPRAAIQDGRVDLRNHIAQRLQTEKAEKLRRERKNRRSLNANEVCALDGPTCSAVWLFVNSNEASIRILNQIVQKYSIRMIRSRKTYERDREAQQQVSELYGAKWLFHCKGAGSKWLQYVTSAGLSITRRARNRRLLTNKREQLLADPTVLSAQWMFGVSTNQQGFSILNQQVSTQAQSTKRARQTRRAEPKEFTGALQAVANGTWLYQRTTPSKTVQQLTRLFRQPQRRVGRRDCFHSLFGRNERLEDELERENARTIRCLFLNGEEEKAKERAEFEGTVPTVTTSRIWSSRFGVQPSSARFGCASGGLFD